MGTALHDAGAHLAKAREFLTAAESAASQELYNAATSNAVVSGINSKDAICLRLTGTTTKGDDHKMAVAELKSSSKVGVDLAPTLERLMRLKTKAQYQTLSVAKKDAENAIRWAGNLYDGAHGIVNS